MNIDSHQHFWQYDPAAHSWMTEAMGVLKHEHLPADLWPLMQANDLQGTVAVQAAQSLHETEWLLALADANPFILGVVGWVDLRAPDVREQLALYARHPKLVGIRHIVQDEPDDDFLLRPEFRRGLALLADFELTYDLLLYPKHLPVARELVQLFPKQRFVLDHLAKPFIKAGTLAPWDKDLRALAKHKHVLCKVSGLVTEADWHGWQPGDFTRYLDVVFDCFGPDRLMFGSDWPVCMLAADYAQVVGLVRDYLSRLPADAQAKVMGGTAAAFYRLDVGRLK